jgi:hypothetical protein
MELNQPEHYCWTCGAKCLAVEWRGYFNTETGEQYTGIDYKCPNNRWWKLTHRETPLVTIDC